jgi:hypothetical protein
MPLGDPRKIINIPRSGYDLLQELAKSHQLEKLFIILDSPSVNVELAPVETLLPRAKPVSFPNPAINKSNWNEFFIIRDFENLQVNYPNWKMLRVLVVRQDIWSTTPT